MLRPAALLLSSMLLSACGQSGDLYLSDAPPAQTTAPVPPPAAPAPETPPVDVPAPTADPSESDNQK